MAIRSSFTASDGAAVSFLETGEGVPFLWIHGWGGSAERQLPLLERLAGHGFHCLCFDQRGYGESPPTENMGIDRSAMDAKELLEHLGIDNAVMTGYSMGAAVLLAYVELYGTARLGKVIIGDMSPKPLNDDSWRYGLNQGWYTKEQMDKDLYHMEHDYEKFAICFAEQTIFLHTPKEPRVFEPDEAYIKAVYERAAREGKKELLDYFMTPPAGSRRANRIYWESCDSRDYRGAVGRIDVPAALFYADPGSLYDPHAAYWMASQIPDVKLYPFRGCTHMATLEKPDEFVSAIVGFAG